MCSVIPYKINTNVLKILISGKTILWNDFITAGITQLKDICYEVKTGFLPDNAIVEMVTNVIEDISQDNIVKRYNAITYVF
jgi:hydroxymethylpyrimidine/phosphomethylpyrimidine kinase